MNGTAGKLMDRVPSTKGIQGISTGGNIAEMKQEAIIASIIIPGSDRCWLPSANLVADT